MALQWDNAYSTGIKEIDQQHMKLFEFVNKLEEQIQKGINKAAVKGILQFLETYARTHFSFEEICMDERRCPMACRNKEAHKQFLELFRGFQAQFATAPDTEALVRQIHSTAEGWLINHICRIDVNLRPSIKAAA